MKQTRKGKGGPGGPWVRRGLRRPYSIGWKRSTVHFGLAGLYVLAGSLLLRRRSISSKLWLQGLKLWTGPGG